VDTQTANAAGREAPVPLTISIRQAQDLSGLSRVTINRRIWSGELKTTHVGSRHLIFFASFRKMLGLDQTEAA